jgi:hypothetical protein
LHGPDDEDEDDKRLEEDAQDLLNFTSNFYFAQDEKIVENNTDFAEI